MKEFLTQMLNVMQKPYCEHDACFVVLNAPFVFRMVWGVMSVLLTAKQKSKAKIMGNSSDAKVRAQLLEMAPANLLPKDLGGDVEGIEYTYPPRPATEIASCMSRMRSIDYWPPAPR